MRPSSRSIYKFLLHAFIVAGFFFMIGFFKRYHLPQLKRLALTKIEEVSRAKSPLALSAQSLDLHLFPLGGTFYDVTLTPQKELEATLAPTRLEKVTVSLSMWALLKAELKLGTVDARGLEIRLNLGGISAENSARLQKKPQFALKDIYDLPIEKVRLRDFKFFIQAPAQGFSGAAVISDFIFENKFNSLRTGLKLHNIVLRREGVVSALTADIDAQILVDDGGLYFSHVQVTRGDSNVTASGSVTGEIAKANFKHARAKIEGQLDLLDLRTLAADLAGAKLPHTSGLVKFDIDLDQPLNADPQANFRIEGERLKIDHYAIGEAKLIGKTANRVVQLTTADLRGTYGPLQLAPLEMKLKDDFALSTVLKSDALDMKALFNALDLSGVPIFANVVADIPCSGQFQPSFALRCDGKMIGRDFALATGKSPTLKGRSTIVAFKDFSIVGGVQIDNVGVNYQTKLTIGKSTGESKGTISYAKGFKIDYATPGLNFADLSDLMGLKPEGIAKLEGQTAGTSNGATIDMKAEGDKLWLSDFFLGRAKWDMRYRKGQLYFDKMEGQIGETTYAADLMIDINKSEMRVVGTLPFLNAEDLITMLSRKAAIPVAITGTGSASIKASGPLDVAKLSYSLQSSLYRGTIAGESYDQIRLNVTSDAGQIKLDDVSLTKGRSKMVMAGRVNRDGGLNLNIDGRGFQIEQSENLAALKVRLTGNLGFEAHFTGLISKPLITMEGAVTDALLGEIPVDDSKFSGSVTGTELKLNADILGNAIHVEMNREFATQGETTAEVRLTNWNFAQVFSIFADSNRFGGFFTRVSGRLKAVVPNASPESFRGELRIDDFLVRNSRAEIGTTKPIVLTAQNGQFAARDFALQGDGSYLRIVTPENTKKLNIEGRLDLTLASLFTPFLDDLRGRAGFAITVDGSIFKPDVSGTAFIENGVVKLKGFPHAFEQMQGDLFIRNGKLVVNALKGRLAGGLFTANGQIEGKGASNLDIDIRGHIDDARLNVPTGFQTRGSADFYVRGSWFPYTVGVVYNVVSGQIESKTTAEEKSRPEIEPSPYLPKSLSAQRFSPIALALDVNIQRSLPVNMTISLVKIQCEVNGQMKVNGPPESPRLTGRIGIVRGGKIQFRNNTFEIRSGTVEYYNGAPENPSLNLLTDAKVTAQLRNNETRDYDIDIRVQGTAQAPKVTVTSDPPLPETELISLLTLGFINEANMDQTEVTAGEQATNTTYQLGSSFINEQLGINRVLESRFGVRFDVNSSYDTTDKAEKHRFSLRKQWTPKFGVSASREVGKTSSSNVKADYKLNKNLSVIGEWEGSEAGDVSGTSNTTTTEDQNIFGLDIEYKVEFK